MGEIVLAAKVSHVPSIMLSEQPGSPLKGTRDGAIKALKELGRRARDRGVTTFVVYDTHWLSNFGYHVNANAHHRGTFTSHEAPHMIQDQAYEHPGNTAFAEAMAAFAQKNEVNLIAHQVRSLGLEYGTIVPMHYMNGGGSAAKVVSVASPLFTSVEESRIIGEATASVAKSMPGERVAVIASGSLSHRLWPNRQLGPQAWTTIASEFNRQMDLRVLELWQAGRYREFCAMLPEYAVKCNGEAGMADTIMLFAALGWDTYSGRAEQLCEYFPSSGSGQVCVEFHGR